jgi:hypothetical protein
MTAAAFHTAGHTTGRTFSFLEILRPFLLLAVLAFLAGFGGYLILGPPNVMSLGAAPQTNAAAVSPATPASAPAATGDWNAPKQV